MKAFTPDELQLPRPARAPTEIDEHGGVGEVVLVEARVVLEELSLGDTALHQ